jgi:ATP-dependent DNA helicase 2 subunit 2
VNGLVLSVHHAIEVMSYFRSVTVMQRATFVGYLEISPILKIRVKIFTRTAQNKFPTMKKFSKLAEAVENPETSAVVLQRSYFSIDNLDEEIPKEDHIKGYKYGRSLVKTHPNQLFPLKSCHLLCFSYFSRFRSLMLMKQF